MGVPFLHRTGSLAGASGPDANRAIFIMLQGGPSHIDLWDPKPDTASDIRGPFRTIPPCAGDAMGSPWGRSPHDLRDRLIRPHWISEGRVIEEILAGG